MFLASVAQPSDVEFFRFYLAEKLHKTVSELEDMEYAEYASWQSYYKVKAQQEQLQAKVAARG